MVERTLPVLMYHGLHSGPQDVGRYDAVYSVHPSDFEQQLDWLLDNGYCSTRLRDLDGAPRGHKPVVITFDDGDRSNLAVALPLLVKRGMVAEFFVTSDFVDQPGMLASADLRALASAGMGVQSHGCTHRYLESLSAGELETELAQSRRQLESWSGTSVDALALPGGRGGERERVAAMRMGYRDVLNSQPGPNRTWNHGDYLQRLPVTRGLVLSHFAALVEWRGIAPRRMRARYQALRSFKRLLGNQHYEHLRAWMLAR